MLGRAAAAIAIASTLLACSVLVDSSGIVGRADAGSSSARPGGATDDGGRIDDASAAADDAAAPIPRFCADAGAHYFCADFDGDDPLAGWTTVEDGGTLTGSTVRARSGPRSLFASVPRRESAKVNAAVAKEIPLPWKRVILEADVFLEPPRFVAGDVNFGVACANFFQGSATGGQCMSVAEDVTFFGDNNAQFPLDRWVHLRIDWDPATAKASATVDGSPFGDATMAMPAGSGSHMVIGVGVIGYNTPCPEVSLYLDNVTIDVID